MNINQILETLSTDLLQVLIVYGIFACAFISNVCFSVRYNVRYLNETMDWGRLIDSLLEAFMIILGSLFLVITIDLFTIVIGVDETTLGDFVTVVAVLTTIGKAIAKYTKEAYNTLESILNTDKTEIK